MPLGAEHRRCHGCCWKAGEEERRGGKKWKERKKIIITGEFSHHSVPMICRKSNPRGSICQSHIELGYLSAYLGADSGLWLEICQWILMVTVGTFKKLYSREAQRWMGRALVPAILIIPFQFGMENRGSLSLRWSVLHRKASWDHF